MAWKRASTTTIREEEKRVFQEIKWETGGRGHHPIGPELGKHKTKENDNHWRYRDGPGKPKPR